MKKTQKQELPEHQDDVLAQLMSEYAEAEGARLYQEYQDAAASGETPEMPEELDRKCRRLLNREFTKQHAQALSKPLLKLAERAAVAVIAGAWLDGGSSHADGENAEALEELLSEAETKKNED